MSLDGSGDSSSPSKKTTEQRSSTTVLPTALTPSGDKSESSEIQEDMSQVATDVTSQSELRLKLHDVTNDDVSDGGIRSNLVTPRSDVASPRSDTATPHSDIATPRSDIATPRSDDYTTPGTDSKVAPTSARSLSEIAEEYSVSIHTEVSSKGDMSHRQISAPVKSTTEPSVDVKSVAPSVETSVTEAQEEGKDEGIAHSESGSSRTLTEESRSERSEKSEHSSSSKTYSQDFSSEGTETGQSTRTEEASRDEESIRTEEDISEEFSVEPDSGESSPRVVDLTADVKTDVGVTEEGVLAHLVEGRRVLVGGVKSGTLRFKGQVEFAPGMWAGVELDDSEGTNDGTKDGVTYFSCRSGHGLFVPPDKITDHPSQDRTETVSIHDDIVTDRSKASIPEEESAAKTKSSPRDVLTPPIDIQTPPIELVDDEQTADDVSIATIDSELDRVISSADAAVTAFDELDMSAEAEVERVLKQESDADSKPETENQVPPVSDTDVIAHSLLTEAISDILNIRRQKCEQLTHDVATISDDSLSFFTTEMRDTEDSNRLISPFERPSTPLGHVTPDVLNKQVSVYVTVTTCCFTEFVFTIII